MEDQYSPITTARPSKDLGTQWSATVWMILLWGQLLWNQMGIRRLEKRCANQTEPVSMYHDLSRRVLYNISYPNQRHAS